jgi:hypothetical protein
LHSHGVVDYQSAFQQIPGIRLFSNAAHCNPEGRPRRRAHRIAITAPNQIFPSSLIVKCEALSPFTLALRTGKRVRIAENPRSGFNLDTGLDRFVDDINFHGIGDRGLKHRWVDRRNLLRAKTLFLCIIEKYTEVHTNTFLHEILFPLNFTTLLL